MAACHKQYKNVIFPIGQVSANFFHKYLCRCIGWSAVPQGNAFLVLPGSNLISRQSMCKEMLLTLLRSDTGPFPYGLQHTFESSPHSACDCPAHPAPDAGFYPPLLTAGCCIIACGHWLPELGTLCGEAPHSGRKQKSHTDFPGHIYS